MRKRRPENLQHWSASDIIKNYRSGNGVDNAYCEETIVLTNISSHYSLGYTNCFFKKLILKSTDANNIQFNSCDFDEIEFDKTNINVIVFRDCSTDSIQITNTDTRSVKILESYSKKIDFDQNNCKVLEVEKTLFENLGIKQSTHMKVVIVRSPQPSGENKGQNDGLKPSNPETTIDIEVAKLEIEINNSSHGTLSIKNSGRIDSLVLTDSELGKIELEKSNVINWTSTNSKVTEAIFKSTPLTNLNIVDGEYGTIRLSGSVVGNYKIKPFDSITPRVKIHNLIADELVLTIDSSVQLNEVDLFSLSLNDLKNDGKLEISNVEITGTFNLERCKLGKATFSNLNLQDFTTIRILNSSIIESKFFNVQWPRDFRLYEYSNEINECKTSKDKIKRYYYPLRESYRQLISVSNKELNRIDALSFQKQELRIYYEIIKFSKYKSWASFGDFLILWTNKQFSDFGQSLWRPLRWWIPIHSVLFYVFLKVNKIGIEVVNIENHDWNFFWKGLGIFINLLNPVHGMEINKVNVMGIVDFSMRVIAGYFLFYFISATRKFHLQK